MDRFRFDILFDDLSLENNIIQEREEFWSLFQDVRNLQPKRILEIGVERGGTARFWQEILPTDGFLVGVDFFQEPLIAMKESPRFVQVKGDSHNSQIIERVFTFEPFDFLFIDGDHSYEGCKLDYENYNPAVKSGGIIAFHDLGHGPVRRVWDEIKGNKIEYHNKLGIGVLFL